MRIRPQLSVLILLALSILKTCELSDAASTLTLRPDGLEGKDATLWSCMPDANFGNDRDYEAMAWTWNSLGLASGVLRGVMEFDLSTIPAGSCIKSARLSLYNNPESSENKGEHASLSGSNKALLQRITEPWEEDLVSWENQPDATDKNEVNLRESTRVHEDYLNIDVTGLVQDMVDFPSESFGFLIKLETEAFYRAVIFASSDHPEAKLRPRLVVIFTGNEQVAY